MNLAIDITEGNELSVITPSGEIDAYTAPQLKDSLLPLTKKEGHMTEVNLAEVHFLDSTGLGIFVSALKSARENNSDIRLVNLQDHVLRIFRLTGLNNIMTIDTAVRGENE